jgi:predicted ATP-grasp superfamily ATP-dependent carboligase
VDRAFITDGNLRSTLAVVRSLGRAGVWVGVGDDETHSMAGASRYCRESVLYPSPVREPEAFQHFLTTELPRMGYTHVLPTSDVTAQLVAPLKDLLEPKITVMISTAEALSRVQDKSAMLEEARQAGMAVPRTISNCSREELVRFAEEVGYPVVIKPRRSREFCNGQWRTGAVKYAWTPAEVVELYESCPIPFPLVQERVVGEGRGVFLLMWEGEIQAAFCHRRLREKPPWGGVSVLCESIPLDPALMCQAATLLRRMQWQGPAMVECKLDERTGETKLMEVNGRYWGSLQLAIDAGVDFPAAHMLLASGESVAPLTSYRTGIQCRWLLGDLDSLISRLRATPRQEMLYQGGVCKLQACVEFMRFLAPKLHYDVMSLQDPAPGWRELCGYFAANVRLAAHTMSADRPQVGSV